MCPDQPVAFTEASPIPLRAHPRPCRSITTLFDNSTTSLPACSISLLKWLKKSSGMGFCVVSPLHRVLVYVLTCANVNLLSDFISLKLCRGSMLTNHMDSLDQSKERERTAACRARTCFCGLSIFCTISDPHCSTCPQPGPFDHCRLAVRRRFYFQCGCGCHVQ